jgi:hypothetical protein
LSLRYLPFCEGFFLEFSERIIKRYSVLFGTPNDKESDFSERSQFSKQWGWYAFYYALADGKFENIGHVGKRKLTEALTFLTFEKQKKDIEEMELKKIQMRANL